MEKLIKSIIVENRHQFIYGSNNVRKKIFTGMETKYPIKIDSNIPAAIYLDEIGFPNIEISNHNIDRIALSTLSREYLSCIIAQKILTCINEESILKSKIETFLKKINTLFLNDNFPEITSIEELIKALKATKTLYYNYYLQKDVIKLDINRLQIPFLDINSFVQKIKEMLNNQSYFCIIADQQKPISIYSQQAINNLVNMRINTNVSIKAACKKDEWKTYYDLSGLHTDNIHDYAELDINKYLKLKKEDNCEKFNNK